MNVKKIRSKKYNETTDTLTFPIITVITVILIVPALIFSRDDDSLE